MQHVCSDTQWYTVPQLTSYMLVFQLDFHIQCPHSEPLILRCFLEECSNETKKKSTGSNKPSFNCNLKRGQPRPTRSTSPLFLPQNLRIPHFLRHVAMSIQILISDAPKLLKSINNHFQGRFLGTHWGHNEWLIISQATTSGRPTKTKAINPPLCQV